MLAFWQNPVKPVFMTMLHFFEAVFRSWMFAYQLPQCTFSITIYLKQFFLNKPGDHTFLLCGMAIIKHTYFHRQIKLP